jgi:hypothetical protein
MKARVRIETHLDVSDTQPKSSTFRVEVAKRIAKDSLQVQIVLGHNRSA